MKKGRKILVLFLSLAMVIGLLAGCGGSKAESKIIYGSTTELSGDLGNAWWTNNASDRLLRNLINDYNTVATDQSGELVINESVCDGIESEENADGTKTFTVKIKNGLTYNNGDKITAADFVAYALIAYSPAALEAGAKTTSGAAQIVGATEYQNGEADVLSGVHLVDENTYSITITADYLPYFFDMYYANLSPLSLKLYSSSELTVKDDGEGAYLDGGSLVASEIDASRYVYADRISAGPYTLKEFDQAALTATLELNSNYAGNFEGQKPSVKTLVVVKAEQETMLDALKTGEIDFLSALTDGAEINTALDMEDEGGFKTVHYPRNGYGKLMFQCDFGPTQFIEVRHAIAYLLDRNEFANQFCQGYGSVVHGPYGVGCWMYDEAKDTLASTLNTYAYSLESATEELEKGGWTLGEDGNPYTSGIRYKEVTAEEAGDYEHNITLSDGRILMPLIIEWASSEGNSVSELLAVMLANGDQTTAAGIKINQSTMTFDELLNYMYRDSTQGEQYGVKTYGMYNLATGFTAMYDQSYNWTMDPDLVELGYNSNYTQDEKLDQLSMDMVYGVDAGDNEKYLDYWVQFIQEYNEYLPEVPLYSNEYHDVMNDKIENLECNSLFDFDQAVVYATIK